MSFLLVPFINIRIAFSHTTFISKDYSVDTPRETGENKEVNV